MDSIDRYLAKLKGVIELHGWMTQAIGSSPAISYTIGFTALSHPPVAPQAEIVVAGIPPEAAHSVFIRMAEIVKGGKLFLDGQRSTDVLKEHESRPLPVVFQTVHFSVVEKFRSAKWWYAQQGLDLPEYLQMFWPDKEGRLPGEPDCDPSVEQIQRICLD